MATKRYNKENPLRVFEAFAGYGSQSLAFKYLQDKHPQGLFPSDGSPRPRHRQVASQGEDRSANHLQL